MPATLADVLAASIALIEADRQAAVEANWAGAGFTVPAVPEEPNLATGRLRSYWPAPHATEHGMDVPA